MLVLTIGIALKFKQGREEKLLKLQRNADRQDQHKSPLAISQSSSFDETFLMVYCAGTCEQNLK